MKTNTSVSIDSKLLAEVRGVPGFNLSSFVEEKLKERVNKPLTSMEKEYLLIVQLKEVRAEVFQMSQRQPEEFKKAVREAKFLGMKTETTKQKIDFWKHIIEEMQVKEVSPAPLPESDKNA